MANDFAHTRRERDWLSEAERNIRQGQVEQLRATLDQAAEDPNIRGRAIAQVPGLIIFARHNKPSNKKREPLLRAYFEHALGVDPDAATHPGLLRGCVEKKLFGLIPLLHERGWRMLETDGSRRDRDSELIAQTLAAGKWCHPDLIKPNLLHDSGASFRLVAGLFSAEVMKQPQFVAQLIALDIPPRFIKAVSKGFVRSHDWQQTAWINDPGNAAACIAQLLQAGWIDREIVEQETLEFDDNVKTVSLAHLSDAQAWMLRQHTPRAQAVRGRRL